MVEDEEDETKEEEDETSDEDSPSSISCLVSSWLALVGRSPMLVNPIPRPINSRSLSAFIGRGIRPDRNRHFPGKKNIERSKC